MRGALAIFCLGSSAHAKLGSSAHAKLGSSAFDVKMPGFSWSTLPVAYHGASYGNFSTASLATLARFPVVTLEKCQGWKNLRPAPCSGFNCTSCCEEDVYTALGAQIKALNASTKVIAYFHSNKAMTWFSVGQNLGSSPSACVNGDDAMNTTAPCTPVQGSKEFYYDYRKPAGAAAYADGCRRMIATGGVDGCFVDGCLKVEAPLGATARGAFVTAKMATLKTLQQQVPGPLICGSGGALNPDLAAAQVQAFSAKHAGWWGNMMHMNASASQGYMFEAHGHELCYNSNLSSPAFQTEYAAFLMFAQRYTYHICGSWCGSDPVWPPVFDLPLGAPLGNATSIDAGGEVWRRRFQSGTEVFFNRTSVTGRVSWGASTRRFIAQHGL